jgi:hypothetical protein
VAAFFEYAKGVMKTEDGEQELLIDFNKFVPQPEKITRDMISQDQWLWADQLDKVCDDELWWYWRAEHWGTKWQPAGAEVTDEEDVYGQPDHVEVFVTFDTAWAPPKPVLLAMSKKFPTLERGRF